MNKKKKSTNIFPSPDEAIKRLARAFYPAILACWNSEEGQRSLVRARPLHLLLQDRSVAQKPHWGFHCCAAQTRVCLGRQSRLIIPPAKKQSVPDCWVSVKQFSRIDTATACQDWLRSTRLGRGSIKSHVRTGKVLSMGLFAYRGSVHLYQGVTH